MKENLAKAYFFTEKGDLSHAQFMQNLQRCLEQGYLFFRFRSQDFDPKTYIKWGLDVVALANTFNARVMVDNVAALQEMHAHGLHATQDLLLSYTTRPVSADYLFAASVHDLHTCAWANQLQADFVTLSPVKSTPSHPTAIPLGWDRFQAIAHHSACPVYALGGLTPDDISVAQQHGAHGIATIRGVWGMGGIERAIP